MKHCLAIAAGDIERATQILIDRQENGQCLNQTNSLTFQVAKKTIDDTELKNRIIERYSYIDKDAFTKEHRPVAPKVEPKKMVRYRDNKIVSLKGERFTEVKKGEDVDDISLKKSKKGNNVYLYFCHCWYVIKMRFCDLNKTYQRRKFITTMEHYKTWTYFFKMMYSI